VVISGLSGAGRSEAAKAFEDEGWFVIDNLPPQLIEKMLALTLSPGNLIQRIALVIDARGGTFFEEADKALEALGDQVSYSLVFLEASDEVLVRRFDATRRRHPLATDDNVHEGISRERTLMQAFRDRADLIIDTTQLSSRDLRMRIGAFFTAEAVADTLATTVISFGFKYGIPVDADIVLDVRFLPNPHWDEKLRAFSGLDEEIKDFVLGQGAAKAFIESTDSLFNVLIPGYRNEGRHYLTVAIGCTGGRHRSVVLAEEVARSLAGLGVPTKVMHRDVERSPVAR
jgi:UPF0042 nucleotide-binding protein